MMEQDLRQTIKMIAVDHFNKHGFYGTTIRNIANEAGCSLPMVYYYYKSKKELFHEIIRKDYFEILEREAKRLKPHDILDFYTTFIGNIMNLSEFEKKIYRLGIKVYLSFDGDEELLSLMNAWEASIVPRHFELIVPHLEEKDDAEVIVRTFIHVLENMIERIIVKNQSLTEHEVREELAILLRGR
ncbi:MAG: TetR/AcrR family transcriptional regulator [Sphaerochaetaceae bacterium]